MVLFLPLIIYAFYILQIYSVFAKYTVWNYGDIQPQWDRRGFCIIIELIEFALFSNTESKFTNGVKEIAVKIPKS